MFDLFHVLLFLHIAAVMVALGPTFVFAVIGGMSAREPQHGDFALRLSLAIDDRLVIPLALTLALTGVGLILTADPSISITEPWLLVSIVLYVIAMALSLGVMRPGLVRLIAMTSRPPQGPAPDGPAGAGDRPPGPPPAFVAIVRRQQIVGTALSILILVIVLLMVVQPGGAGA